MKKQDLVNLLGDVKSGKIKIDNLIEQMSTSRKMIMQQEDFTCKDLKNGKAYLIIDNKIFSLPLKKKREDGRIAEFVPYYRTVKNA